MIEQWYFLSGVSVRTERSAGAVVAFGDSITDGAITAVDANHRWIRTSGAYDGVIDFEAAIRDPAEPDRILARYDSGDHLHPNDAGMEAMAAAIPLRLFR